MPAKHNHETCVLLDPGKCPGCDESRKLTDPPRVELVEKTIAFVPSDGYTWHVVVRKSSSIGVTLRELGPMNAGGTHEDVLAKAIPADVLLRAAEIVRAAETWT